MYLSKFQNVFVKISREDMCAVGERWLKPLPSPNDDDEQNHISKCICLNVKCICQNFEMYLLKLQFVFVSIAKYICW